MAPRRAQPPRVNQMTAIVTATGRKGVHQLGCRGPCAGRLHMSGRRSGQHTLGAVLCARRLADARKPTNGPLRLAIRNSQQPLPSAFARADPKPDLYHESDFLGCVSAATRRTAALIAAGSPWSAPGQHLSTGICRSAPTFAIASSPVPSGTAGSIGLSGRLVRRTVASASKARRAIIWTARSSI